VVYEFICNVKSLGQFCETLFTEISQSFRMFSETEINIMVWPSKESACFEVPFYGN